MKTFLRLRAIHCEVQTLYVPESGVSYKGKQKRRKLIGSDVHQSIVLPFLLPYDQS